MYLPKSYQKFSEEYPEVPETYQKLGKECGSSGPLEEKGGRCQILHSE